MVSEQTINFRFGRRGDTLLGSSKLLIELRYLALMLRIFFGEIIHSLTPLSVCLVQSVLEGQHLLIKLNL